MKRSIAAVATLAAAAVLAGCSSNGPAPADGQVRPLGFGVSKRIELFVPQGWDMVNQDDLVVDDPTDPPPASGVTYALLDRSRIPEQVSDAVADDAEARGRFTDAALDGAAITAQFSELTPCDSVRTLLEDRRSGADFDTLDEVDHGIGEDRTLGVAARETDTGTYRYVQYYASVPLTGHKCVALVLESTLRAPDDAAVGAARDRITEIADHSRIDTLVKPGSDSGSGD